MHDLQEVEFLKPVFCSTGPQTTFKWFSNIDTAFHDQFDFLGFTFQPRLVKSNIGKYFVSFSPAISKKAANEKVETAIKMQQDTVRNWLLYQSNS